MAFTAKDYLDNEYLNYQDFISTLSVTIPNLKPTAFRDEKQLLRALVNQNKSYAKKIIDLFEELSKEIFTTTQSGGKKEPEAKQKVTSPVKSTGRTKSQSSPIKSEDLLAKQTQINHLEKKIEYLNTFSSECKRNLEEKNKELDSLSKKYKDLLTQFNGTVEEKYNLTEQLKEMCDISDNIRTKFDIHLEDIMIEKDKEINELKRQLESSSRTEFNTESTRNRPSHSDATELREKLQEKERELARLRSELLAVEGLESNRQSLNPTALFDLFGKIKQLGIKLDDLNIVANKLCEKYGVEVTQDPVYRRLVELSEMKTDQMAQVVNPICSNKIDDMKVQLEKLWDRLEFEAVTSPRKDSLNFNKSAQLKDSISLAREEIQEQLKSSALHFEKTNNNEFFNELQQEIEKNYELQQSYDDLKKSVQKIGLIVSDEFEKLASLFDISFKVEISNFRSEITNAKKKLFEFIEKYTLEPLRVDAEYENQRIRWHEKIVSQADLYTQELQKLKGVIESERQASEKSVEKLKAEKERLRNEILEIEGNYKQAEERYINKITKLEAEILSHKDKIKSVKSDSDVYEKLIQEREDTILSYSSTINEWQDKCTSIEADNLKLLNENSKIRGLLIERDRELELFKENNKNLIAEKSEIGKVNEARNEEMVLTKVENEQLKERIQNLQAEIEDEKLTLLEKFKGMEREYNEFVEMSNNKLAETKADYEEALKQTRTQLEERNSSYEKLRVQYDEDIQLKEDELRAYASTSRTQEEFTRSQAAGIRSRDEKIAQQNEEIRELQIKIKNLEVQLEEHKVLKEKSKKYFDMITTTSHDLTNLKGDLQRALHERNEATAKSNRSDFQIQELRDELNRIKDQYQSTRHLIEDYKSQLQVAKHEYEALEKRVQLREREIKEFEEANSAQNKSTIAYKDETISRLRSDVKFLTAKLEDLQREYQKIIEKNEDLLLENQKLKNLALESELGLNAAEKLNNINDDLLLELEQVKKRLEVAESSFEKERGYLKKDLTAANKKIQELEKKLEKDNRAFKR